MTKVRVPRRRVVRRKRPVKRMAKLRRYRGPGYISFARRISEQIWASNPATAGAILSYGSVAANGIISAATFGATGYYNIPGSMAFRLSDILSPTDITNMFDQYKLDWVKIRIYCTSTTASVASTAQLPSILYSTDDDDVSFPTLANLREKMSSKQRMFYPGRPVVITIKPKASVQLGTALTNTGNAIKASPWINCAYDTVPHYGLKFVILDAFLPGTTTANTQFKFDVTYGLKAKGVQ